MQAAILSDRNQPLQIVDHPIPEPRKGEARVRLHAAALNRRDVWIQQGMYANLQYPALLGSDGAGTVDAVGDDKDAGWLGQEIIINACLHWGPRQEAPQPGWGILGMPTEGTLAEYVAVPIENLAAKPGHLSWQEAAGLPLAGLTAFRALFYRGQLQQGQKVLITGAGGGAAQLALAFAKAAGAEVWITSSSEQKRAHSLQAGAAGGVLYTEADWSKKLKEQAGLFDIIIDSGGGQDFDKLVELTVDGGRIVVFGGTAGAWPALRPQRVFWKQLSILGTTMGSPADFAHMLAFVSEHWIQIPVGANHHLSDVNSAFAAMREGQSIGKITVTIA